MPIYEYECGNCGHRLESIQKFSDEPLTDCPECQQAALKKLVSAAAFHLKGNGWYVTDFRGDKKGDGKAKDDGEAKNHGEAKDHGKAKDDAKAKPDSADKGSSKETKADKSPAKSDGGGSKKSTSTSAGRD